MAEGPWVISLVGLHDAGKTTVGEALVRELTKNGLRIAVIKHEGDHVGKVGASDWGTSDSGPSANADVLGWEKPSSDTRRYAAAGAAGTMLAGRGETLWRMADDGDADSPTVLIQRLVGWFREAGSKLDGIVVEGFKRSTLPKVAVLRDWDALAWLRESALTNLVAIVVSGEDSAGRLRHDAAFPSGHFAGFEGVPVYRETQLDLLCHALVERLNKRFS